ncbi:ATP-binding protein [Sphaerisporangium fuscum]|uniref:ATP-binding protein n=1 Tax=Sphaerisporangium fuscum TaxID=2835868 RepID=UPI001BDD4C44|nr:ATP-binding protein [Sphaerisporangium fuscum]
MPADLESVKTARSLVRQELCLWGTATLADDCSLIVSELVTNAIRHGGTAFSLRLGSDGGWVYGEVFDAGDGLPCETSGDLGATDGRGLLIVAALADDWGVLPAEDGGKTVWFVAGLGGEGPTPRLGGP